MSAHRMSRQHQSTTGRAMARPMPFCVASTRWREECTLQRQSLGASLPHLHPIRTAEMPVPVAGRVQQLHQTLSPFRPTQTSPQETANRHRCQRNTTMARFTRRRRAEFSTTRTAPFTSISIVTHTRAVLSAVTHPLVPALRHQTRLHSHPRLCLQAHSWMQPSRAV